MGRPDKRNNRTGRSPSALGPGTKPPSGIPARQWSDYEPTHGATSARVVGERAPTVRAELVRLLREHLPYVEDVDGPLLNIAADVVSKLELMSEWFDAKHGGGLLDARGRPLPAADLYLRLQRQCIGILDRLGVGPSARAVLIERLGHPDPNLTVLRGLAAAGEQERRGAG
jgi:hypothetical protein